MGGALNKALLPLAGRPVLTHVLEMWQGLATDILVAVRPEDWQAAAAIAAPYGQAVRLIAGGEYRAASVAQALWALAQDTLPQLIAVHDAARPLTASNDIKRVIDAAQRTGAAMLAAPLDDTIRWQAEGLCGALLPRAQLLAAQTPQIFRAGWLVSAYAAADEAALAAATDDAALTLAAGYPCAYVWASCANFKLTRPEDVALAEALLQTRGVVVRDKRRKSA
jgi:2-C-methyl-D-erythritol 4-phosphate cytidylyltransferase